MMRQPLSDSELKILTYIGRYRHFETNQKGTNKKQDATLDDEEMAIRGVITEYAVAKAMNLHFDVNCNYRKFGEDLRMHNGMTIDVKSCKVAGGDLNAVLWSADSGKACDVYILTEYFPSAVGLVGWIEAERFFVPENIVDKGYGDFYSYPRNRLRQFNVENGKATL